MIEKGSGVPIGYDYTNLYNAQFSPSSVHVRNTQLQNFFRRYLTQKAVSVFKWKLPESWDRDYFLYVLYTWGFIGVIETDKFGVIPQAGALSGYDIFYRPTTLTITHPLLKGILTPRIGTQCTLFKLAPDYCGIMDLINYYADMLALCAETAGVNMLNSHVSYVFGAENKQTAETYKKLFDEIAGGEPAVVVGKNLFNADGTPAWTPFTQNVGQNYIASDLLSDMRKIEAMFDTVIGIPNANTDKRERLITDEVNANQVETSCIAELWLESLQKSAADTRDMFGIEISVDWRHNPNEGGVDHAESETLRPGPVPR